MFLDKDFDEFYVTRTEAMEFLGFDTFQDSDAFLKKFGLEPRTYKKTSKVYAMSKMYEKLLLKDYMTKEQFYISAKGYRYLTVKERNLIDDLHKVLKDNYKLRMELDYHHQLADCFKSLFVLFKGPIDEQKKDLAFDILTGKDMDYLTDKYKLSSESIITDFHDTVNTVNLYCSILREGKKAFESIVKVISGEIDKRIMEAKAVSSEGGMKAHIEKMDKMRREKALFLKNERKTDEGTTVEFIQPFKELWEKVRNREQ